MAPKRIPSRSVAGSRSGAQARAPTLAAAPPGVPPAPRCVAFAVVLVAALALLAACGRQPVAPLAPTAAATTPLDAELQALVRRHDLGPLDPGPRPEAAKVALGRALFFDPLLSGNRDISCATCHHPNLTTGDALPLSLGTGGHGLGRERARGEGRAFVPRNAPELFNRGAPEWRSVFWDSRVERVAAPRPDSRPFGAEWLATPAGVRLPDGLDSVLAAQAMFPVTSRTEMLGDAGDLDAHGRPNALALHADDDLPGIWRALTARLLAVDEYVRLFRAAYPDTPPDALGFQHAANAIAAFEIDAFTLLASPWDRYLAGETGALSDEAKAGARLFYGEAGCARCHSGRLLTDQRHHNIGVPQFGPGKDALGRDLGRFHRTGAVADVYAFRTPPLRNVAATGPWGHDGAFGTLEAVVRHHLDPVRSLLSYDPAAHLSDPELRASVRRDPITLGTTLLTLDPLLRTPTPLDDAEVALLLAFLEALTDPAIAHLAVPARVPSGLPLD